MPRGGARPGAGRKPKAQPADAGASTPVAHSEGGVKLPGAPAAWPFGTRPPGSVESEVADAQQATPELPAGPQDETPVAAMLRVMRESTDPRMVLQAAVAAAPYLHPKKAPISAKAGGEAEKKPSRFAPPTAPKLVHSR